MLNHSAGLGGLGNEIMIWILMTAARAGNSIHLVFPLHRHCPGRLKGSGWTKNPGTGSLTVSPICVLQ